MKDYYQYLPEATHASLWGCSLNGIGFSKVPPGSPYPVLKHPNTYHFSWKSGRILQNYALVLVSEGEGIFEYGSPRRRIPITPGSLITLFPGQWHRYAPNPSTGWTEHWISCRGAAFDAAAQAGVLVANQPVLQTFSELNFTETFHWAHAVAHRDALAHLDLLAVTGLHLLAAISDLRCNGIEKGDGLSAAIRRAQAMMMNRCDALLSTEDLARELGMGYSNFRQAFKKIVGTSPKRYYRKLRISRAQDLLVNTEKTVQQISDLLGFSSAFHFSKQFKASIGISPHLWRTKIHLSAKKDAS